MVTKEQTYKAQLVGMARIVTRAGSENTELTVGSPFDCTICNDSETANECNHFVLRRTMSPSPPHHTVTLFLFIALILLLDVLKFINFGSYQEFLLLGFQVSLFPVYGNQKQTFSVPLIQEFSFKSFSLHLKEVRNSNMCFLMVLSI